jgi:peptide-methionine (R)-S-oxide reductase
MDKTINRSDAEWRARLTPEQYRILREGGTEAPWSGDLLNIKDQGEFCCAATRRAIIAARCRSPSNINKRGFVVAENPAGGAPGEPMANGALTKTLSKAVSDQG